MKTLITNARIFNGCTEQLEDKDVLIDGSIILHIAPNLKEERADTVIDGTGKILLPGLIDTHIHIPIFILKANC